MSATQNYYSWLHDVTILGYEKELAISSEASEQMDEYYREGKTPSEALELYIKSTE